MKKSLALILAVLMLVPCFLTAASAAWGDPKVEEPAKAAEGYVLVKDECIFQDDEGVEKSFTEWSYNKAGQPIREVTERYGQDEDTYEEYLAWTKTTTYAYDGSGDLTRKATTTVGYGGSTSKEVTAYVYNQDGDLVKESRSYKGGGGPEKSVIKYAYDRDDNLVKRSAVFVYYSSTRKEASAYTYNSAGQQTKEITIVRRPDETEKTVIAYAYDKKGNLKKTACKKYVDGEQVGTYAEANTYDKQGKLTKTRYVERGTDGTNIQITRLYTYWKNGKLKKTVDTKTNNPNYLRTSC